MTLVSLVDGRIVAELETLKKDEAEALLVGPKYLVVNSTVL